MNLTSTIISDNNLRTVYRYNIYHRTVRPIGGSKVIRYSYLQKKIKIQGYFTSVIVPFYVLIINKFKFCFFFFN